MVDEQDARTDVVEEISSQLIQAHTDLQIPVLLDTYLLGQALGRAESDASTNDEKLRYFLTISAKQAVEVADRLSSDTPLSVPLHLSDIAGGLRTIAALTETAALSDLHGSLLFVRGKCQGIFDVTGPENFWLAGKIQGLRNEMIIMRQMPLQAALSTLLLCLSLFGQSSKVEAGTSPKCASGAVFARCASHCATRGSSGCCS